MTIKYNICYDDGTPSSITAFIDGQPLVAMPEHASFSELLTALGNSSADDQYIAGLFNVSTALSNKFQRVSERVSINNGKVFFDGEEQHGDLADHIMLFHAAGQTDFQPLVLFMEKLKTNPNPHSIDHLFRWLRRQKLTIAQDGDFIGYKGVQRGDRDGDPYVSSSVGTATVNGLLYRDAQIPTSPGCTVEMPRSAVTFDPHHGCSTGLHVGTWDYASGFGPIVLRVKVNPRDVVSVPTDCSDAKMRCCRYVVMGGVTSEDRGAMLDVDEVMNTLALQAQPRSFRRSTAKRPRKTKAKTPKFFEDFTKRDFVGVTFTQLRWLAKEWGVKMGPHPKRDDYITALAKMAARRRAALKAGKARKSSRIKSV